MPRAWLPHVTLDLREEFRTRCCLALRRRLVRGETPNPCGRCNGSFRFDALLAFAARAGASRSGSATTRASSSETAGASSPARQTRAQGSVVHARDGRLPSSWKASTSRRASRRRTRHGARRSRRPRCGEPSREPGGVLPRWRRLPRVSRARRAPTCSPGRSWTRPARSSAATRACGRFTPGQRRGLAVAAAEPLYALRTEPTTAIVVVGPKSSLATTIVTVEGTLHLAVVQGGGQAAVPRARGRLRGRGDGPRLHAHARRGRVRRRSRAASSAVYDDEGAVVGSGIIRSTAGQDPAHARARVDGNRRCVLRAGDLPGRDRPRHCVHADQARADVRATGPRSSRAPSGTCCP